MVVKLTWLGTAAYLLDLDGTRLMCDPFFYRQTNPKAEPELKTRREDISNIDGIFISHGHIDHITDAGWFAEYKKVPVYCSEVAKENIISWAKGEVDPQETHDLSEEAKNEIHVANWGDLIEINEDVSVEILESKHIKFDFNTIFARIKSKEFWKNVKALIPLGKLPAGDVFGFGIRYKDIKLISYGSLWHKNEEVLKNNRDCKVFIAPIAGNSKKHLAEKSRAMIKILQPEIVIPLHWDNFYPPISRTEDLDPFLKMVETDFPNIQVIMPEIDKEILLEVN